ncbi:ion transporter [Coralliovum pocilloporae]|uniref:ion transporter n=1 Tax=Coralliovum pocilloporae TaxID=3066369 RepID=UPI0033078784
MTTDQTIQQNTLRKRVFDKLEPTDRSDMPGKLVDLFLITLIAVNIIAVVLETVASIRAEHQRLFEVIELVSVAIFTVEYIARLWSCVENPDYTGETSPRRAYMLSPMAIIDLIAILPFYLSFVLAIDLRVLRVLRLLRVFKLTRYSSAMSMLLNVIREEANAFFAGFFILMVLLILAASGAYLVEHDAQPDKFGSIPHAMWWAMATLTTVGYGDVTPVTPAGQFFGALVTVIGVGMAALPAGILASGLADQLRRNREELTSELRRALEDGIIDENEESELEELRKSLGLSQRIAREVRKSVHDQREASETFCCPECGTVTVREVVQK